MTDQTAKKNQHRTIVVMWAALIMSVFIYLGFTFIMQRQGDLNSARADQIAEQATEAAVNESESGGDSATVDGVAPAADPLAGILYPFGLAMALAGLALGHARPLWKDAETAKKLNLISLVLCESCALMGFVIFLQGKGDATEPRSMMVMAIVCMATLYPSPKKMHLA